MSTSTLIRVPTTALNRKKKAASYDSSSRVWSVKVTQSSSKERQPRRVRVRVRVRSNNNSNMEQHMIGDDVPSSSLLHPVCSESQFDLITSSQGQGGHHLLLIVWMANWCRKCIYLKPKLEKLASEYYPRLLFYCVNVNAVPHKLISRAGITKMPTIQLWKDGKQHSEIIGGHKGHLVVNEVREMIESENNI